MVTGVEFFVFVPGSFDVGDAYHALALSQEKVARERVRPMMLGELNAIVAGGESEQVEFKRSTGQRTDAAKAVCAMLNARGGFMLFGVTDAGEMVGQQVTAKTLEDVVRELRKIEPSVLLHPEEVALSGDRSVIVIPVPQLGGGPYTYDG